jgi:hypothetical protein
MNKPPTRSELLVMLRNERTGQNRKIVIRWILEDIEALKPKLRQYTK